MKFPIIGATTRMQFEHCYVIFPPRERLAETTPPLQGVPTLNPRSEATALCKRDQSVGVKAPTPPPYRRTRSRAISCSTFRIRARSSSTVSVNSINDGIGFWAGRNTGLPRCADLDVTGRKVKFADTPMIRTERTDWQTAEMVRK